MEEKLDQFQKNEVGTLVEPPSRKGILGAKWMFRNKLEEQGKVLKNMARLVAKGYSQ